MIKNGDNYLHAKAEAFLSLENGDLSEWNYWEGYMTGLRVSGAMSPEIIASLDRIFAQQVVSEKERRTV